MPQAVVAQLELSGFPGVLVTKVMPDSPAAKAGLQENDVIIKLGDISLSGPRSVTEALSEKVPGDKITAVFYRKGKRETAVSRWTAERFLRKKYWRPREIPAPSRAWFPPSGARRFLPPEWPHGPAFRSAFWTCSK